MKRIIAISPITWFLLFVLFLPYPSSVKAEESFVTIGGGDFAGVYFPVGLAIAEMLNNKRQDHGIRTTVEATPGSTFNLRALLAGYQEFGLAQADDQYYAVNGLAEWAQKGPQEDLRAVFRLYHESVNLVAAVDAGISSIADLEGKRVSLGNPGGRHRVVIEILEAFGLDPKSDLQVKNVHASEAPVMLQDDVIDAYFFTVGHPSEAIRLGLSSEREAQIVPISGAVIDELLAEKTYYTLYTIPMQRFYPVKGGTPDDVETLGVNATLCTSARVPEEVVYALTREVFENLETFSRRHPALIDLQRESMLEGLAAPLHPGALRYFREVGLNE